MRSFTLPLRPALLAPALILAGAIPAHSHEWELLEQRIVSKSKQVWSLVLNEPDTHSGLALGAATTSASPIGERDALPTDLGGHPFAMAANQTAQLYLKREHPDAHGTLVCALKAEDGTEAGFLLEVHGLSSEFRGGPGTGGSPRVTVQSTEITLLDGNADTPPAKTETKGGN
jgi:hypothetical protein